jgi:hypothetical protein
MKDVFEIMLGKRAEQGKILFDKVTFTMPEFIIQDELIYQARAEALECSFILFCSDFIGNVTNVKNNKSFIDIYDRVDFNKHYEAYYYLFGKYNLVWEELELISDDKRKESNFEIMIEELLNYFNKFWKEYIHKTFNKINPDLSSDILLDSFFKTFTNEEYEKSHTFFINDSNMNIKELSIEI